MILFFFLPEKECNVYGLTRFGIRFFLLSQMISVSRGKFNSKSQLGFRLIKGMIFLTSVLILVILIAVLRMTVQDIFICILAFAPTGWGMLQVNYLSTANLLNENSYETTSSTKRG